MLRKEDAVMVVVDIQDVLLPKDEKVVAEYLQQAERMIRVVRALDIPILVTEQYPERLGTTNEGIRAALGDVPALPKMAFGCLGDDAFKEALAATGRRQLLVVGMEAHVCVLQTVLEALAADYEVFLVADAIVSSRKREYKAGMARMTQAGAQSVTAEMAIFELLRKAGTPEFKQVLPLIKG